MDNPNVFMIHENNCLDEQEQNGLTTKPYEKMTVKELKEIAKEKGIEKFENMKRPELIETLKGVIDNAGDNNGESE